MRFRKSRASDGLLGGQDNLDSGNYDDDDRKLRAFKKKFYFTLFAALLTIAVSALRRYRTGEWWALFGDSGSEERQQAQTRVGLSTKDEVDDVPRKCTKSPLESRQARPQYGCADIEKILKGESGESKFLGRGYWREVHLVNYDGQDMALKTLREDQKETARNKERHRWEAAAMDALKDHPNIVHLLGKCESDMVTEYFPNYLDTLLLGVGVPSDSSEDSPDPVPLVEISTRRILEMALDAARGLQALHEVEGGPIVHADLQPRQLLLDDHGVVKINDLNRCRFMGRDEDGKPCPFKISKGNGVWRAPEEYSDEKGRLTEKLDVYSMGMIFWAMYGREAPFKRDSNHHYKDKALAGERPRVDDSWHEGFVKLFQEMWDGDPLKRPSAREAAERLEIMLKNLPEDS